MFKFTSLLLAVTALDQANGWADNVRNPGGKDGLDYSTIRKNDLEFYRTVGNTFEISPLDDFEFTPAHGYGVVKKLRAETEAHHFAGEEGGLRKLKKEDPHAVIDGFENAKLWAREQLDSVEVRANTAPVTNENMVGRELEIIASKQLVEEQDALVACHVLEHLGKDDFVYACHLAKHVGVVEVTVAPYGLPSTLYAACHDDIGGMDTEPFCHILSIHDTMFTVETAEEVSL
jgi:hypothetical protein